MKVLEDHVNRSLLSMNETYDKFFMRSEGGYEKSTSYHCVQIKHIRSISMSILFKGLH